MTIINNMPFHEYFSAAGLSASGLKRLIKSPAHYKYAPPSPDTDALRIGRAIHAVNLEGDWDSVVVAPAINRRTKDGRAEYAAFLAENEGRTVVCEEEMATITGMYASLRSHKTAMNILSLAESFEASFFWSESGVRCKSRADVLCKKIPIIAEYKTTEDASVRGFGRSITSYNYWVAVSHYLAGGFSELSDDCRYLFIVQEKHPPYLVAVYRPDDDFIARATERRRVLLDLYADCTANNYWPGYSEGIETIKLAEWV